MNQSDLLKLIQGDATALAMANTGDDVGCAARCSVIAPQVVSPTPVLLGQLGILKIFALAGQPYGGSAFMAALETMSTSGQPYSDSVRRLLQSIYPPADGVDFTEASIIGELVAFQSAGLLTALQVSTITAATMVLQVITADQVSAAMLGNRTLGN